MRNKRFEGRSHRKEPPPGLVEIAESDDLQAVTQYLREQPPRQVRGRFAAKAIAPLSAKTFEFKAFQAGEDCRQRSVSR